MAGEPASHVESHPFVKGVHGIRYQVKDVARAVAFYTQRLGFKLEHQQLPAFANISLGSSRILLSGPGASGSRPMPDGRLQEPGGWNRVVLRVVDLPGCIAALERAGLSFRNQMEAGPEEEETRARGARTEDGHVNTTMPGGYRSAARLTPDAPATHALSLNSPCADDALEE